MAACRPECYVRLGRVEASCVLRAHYSMYPECRMGQVRYLNSPAVLMQSYTRWVGQLTASWAACCCIYAPVHPGQFSRGPARGAICLAARWHPHPCVSSGLARAGSGSDKVCTQLVRLPGRWARQEGIARPSSLLSHSLSPSRSTTTLWHASKHSLLLHAMRRPRNLTCLRQPTIMQYVARARQRAGARHARPPPPHSEANRPTNRSGHALRAANHNMGSCPAELCTLSAPYTLAHSPLLPVSYSGGQGVGIGPPNPTLFKGLAPTLAPHGAARCCTPCGAQTAGP